MSSGEGGVVVTDDEEIADMSYSLQHIVGTRSDWRRS
jgi:dTDP-4-amino-4,6-dideoxygalactose transaminase